MAKIAVFGYGPTGREICVQALARGHEVQVAQRHRPNDLAPGASFIECDALDAGSVISAAHGVGHIVLAIGLAYDSAVWRKAWPQIMRNFVAAAEKTGARLVFIDNLYMYGPQTSPLVETMPLTSYGAKPAIRAEATQDMDGGRGGGPRESRGAPRSRLLRASDRAFVFRGLDDRGDGEGKGGALRRLSRRPARLCLCARYSAGRAVADRRAGLRLRAGLACPLRAHPHNPRASAKWRRTR